ncbi:MAG TPA: hypothetical protein VEA16_08340, partial [Vicinamibacterales bacterium]|nr:hypothetical protein [Vicinamibacterales bacterium]
PDQKLSERMLKHPLHVVWTITPPDGHKRTTETDSGTLVQFFNSPGQVKVSAVLRWRDQEIPVKGEGTLTVMDNPDYRARHFFGSGGSVEWSVLAVSILFAIATAMSTQYTATFGSMSDYLTMLIWAAGAGTGGNMFKQLGAGNVVGGQSEAALPAR